MDLVLKVLLLSASSVAVVSAATCQSNSYVDGCSIPSDIDLFYKNEFTPSCNMHDICYYCVSISWLLLWPDICSLTSIKCIIKTRPKRIVKKNKTNLVLSIYNYCVNFFVRNIFLKVFICAIFRLCLKNNFWILKIEIGFINLIFLYYCRHIIMGKRAHIVIRSSICTWKAFVVRGRDFCLQMHKSAKQQL